MNLNKVFLFGNLTRDPELRQTSAGQSVCSFSIATNSFFSDKSGEKQKRTEFHNIVAWGRQAEIVSQYLRKGSSAFIEGRLQTRSWQDAQGQTRKTAEIICERLQLGPRTAGSASAFSRESQTGEGNKGIEQEESLPEIDIDDEGIKTEDVPF